MTAPLIVVSGTGTGIGKTHVAAALVAAWARTGASVAGFKPIESGVVADRPGEDAALLEQMSTFHVKRPISPYMLARPVSPHLAARLEGLSISVGPILDWLAPIREQADGLILELAGGLFTPLGPGLTNHDVALALAPDAVLIVAPDRLGVLHDVAAVTRAAGNLRLAGVVLSAPAAPDASTSTNARELELVTDVPVLATFPRAPIADLIESAGAVLERLLLGRRAMTP